MLDNVPFLVNTYLTEKLHLLYAHTKHAFIDIMVIQYNLCVFNTFLLHVTALTVLTNADRRIV